MKSRMRDIIISSIVAVLMGLFVSGLMILLLGKNPISSYSILFKSVVRDKYTIGEIFVKATPLIFSALAFAFAFKASLFNIGVQGQFYIGAVVSVWLSLSLPYWYALPLIFIATIVGGGLWASFIGFAKAKFNSNEFLISMMSTYVALAIMNYLLRTFLMEAKGEYPQTDSLVKSVWLPVLFKGTRVHLGFILAVVIAILIWFLLFKTRLGYRVRAVGYNKNVAKISGINPNSICIIVFAISGGLGALAGFTEVNGVQHMLLQGFNPYIGSIGIGIAILANSNPIGIIFASILFGTLQVGGIIMGQRSGIPSSIIDLMIGFVMIFVIISYYFTNKINIRKEKKLLKGVE